jgi:Cation transporter/ATPase, N-terminus
MEPSVTNPQGLTSAEAARRLAAEGPNALPAAGRRGQGLMCSVALSREAIEIAHLVDIDRCFETGLRELREFEKEGMLVTGDAWITVGPRGRFMIRSICTVFDKYLRTGAGRYSRTI